MFGALDISTSGLIVQRTRMDVISTNILNAETILDENGNYAPFKRRMAAISEGDPVSGNPMGVHVSEIKLIDSPPQLKYEPDSPYANEDGYVGYPNINPIVEQMNAMEAGRAYEANISVIEATKSMLGIALQILS